MTGRKLVVHSSGFIAIAILISLFVAEGSFAQGRSLFGGRLWRSVSDWSAGDPFASKDRSNVPESVRARFDNFVRCRATFRSGLAPPKTFFEKAASDHRRAVERALTCLFTGPAIAALATEYARNTRILYEWEALPSSPIEEASYAEEYIAEHPHSPFASYLYLFAAERWRYAYEFFARDRDAKGAVSSSAKYRELIALARKADPLILLVADDLDGIRYLATDVARHPRDP